jgi:DNA-binding NtrC family response regulator
MKNKKAVLNRRVWILEDDSDLRSLLGHIAGERGYEVSELKSVTQARELTAQSDVPPPHLVVSDLLLRDGSSVDWIMEVRRRYAEAWVVCLSATIDTELMEHLHENGVLAVEKPINLSTLLRIFSLQP